MADGFPTGERPLTDTEKMERMARVIVEGAPILAAQYEQRKDAYHIPAMKRRLQDSLAIAQQVMKNAESRRD